MLMNINNLDVEDIDKIMKLECEVFGHIAEDKEVITDRIKTFKEGCFGIFDKNQLIGYCSSEIWGKYNDIKLNVKASKNHVNRGRILYITAVAIKPEYQNKGLGTRLIRSLVRVAKKHALSSLYLRTSNARKFYEKNGFQFIKHVSERNDNYDVMELRLKPEQ